MKKKPEKMGKKNWRKTGGNLEKPGKKEEQLTIST
jgi:hypothetical protein